LFTLLKRWLKLSAAAADKSNTRQAVANTVALLSTVGNVVLEKICKVLGGLDKPVGATVLNAVSTIFTRRFNISSSKFGDDGAFIPHLATLQLQSRKHHTLAMKRAIWHGCKICNRQPNA